jgi:surface carbohydrate biosynthesis protein
MMHSKKPLILPVETHVRELDGKLLLAAFAAETGRAAYVGSQNEIRAHIASLPAGHFIAKGFASRKARFLSILQQLGHTILAWDEEGLVHPEPEIYYKRRISPQSLAFLDGVFSWGDDFTSLFRAMPFYDGTPIYSTGNPRLDLLDERVRNYFVEDAAKHTATHGKFILLNSNFGRINSAVKRSRDKGVAGKLTDPTLDAKWQAMIEHRKTLYHHFRQMFAGLCEAFPDWQIILRPHPSERIESWQDIPAKYSNAHVIYEGNVLPWLLSAGILIHNGCTTALESVLLNKPALAYMPVRSEEYDWHLPNDISHQIESFDKLVERISSHISGKKPLRVLESHKKILANFAHWDSDKLCCQLILEVLDSLDLKELPKRKSWPVMWATFRAGLRALEKRLRALRPGDIYAPWHQDKHFPDFTLEEMQNRLERMKRSTGRLDDVRIEKVRTKIFKLSRAQGKP